jgi:hypothetical protein
LQNDHPVPGEDQIEVTPAELFHYANALAVKNGFSPIAATQPEKDANLVLPGDRLTMPDGRLLQIQPKQYIYDIAEKEYRRDMARILLLEKQIQTLLAVYSSEKKPEVVAEIRSRKTDIDRLAITPLAREKAAAVASEIDRSALPPN